MVRKFDRPAKEVVLICDICQGPLTQARTRTCSYGCFLKKDANRKQIARKKKADELQKIKAAQLAEKASADKMNREIRQMARELGFQTNAERFASAAPYFQQQIVRDGVLYEKGFDGGFYRVR